VRFIDLAMLRSNIRSIGGTCEQVREAASQISLETDRAAMLRTAPYYDDLAAEAERDPGAGCIGLMSDRGSQRRSE
jgi:hypothetical protein